MQHVDEGKASLQHLTSRQVTLEHLKEKQRAGRRQSPPLALSEDRDLPKAGTGLNQNFCPSYSHITLALSLLLLLLLVLTVALLATLTWRLSTPASQMRM